jgi:hypothetical protein
MILPILRRHNKIIVVAAIYLYCCIYEDIPYLLKHSKRKLLKINYRRSIELFEEKSGCFNFSISLYWQSH